MSGSVHRFRARASWLGSTGGGYEAYTRTHVVAAPPAQTGLELSGDPAFLGDASRLNPEQLLVAAAASCQLLSFLAVAARARVDVTAYEDDAEGLMPTDARPISITEIVLRPTIHVTGEVTEERVRHLVEVGHRECFIANSLRTEVRVEPTIIIE